jgi:hypothetical protein
MANSKMSDLKPADYPLAVTVTGEDDREIYRTTVDSPAGRGDWSDLVTPDLDGQYPGEKKLSVTSASGKTVHESKVG